MPKKPQNKEESPEKGPAKASEDKTPTAEPGSGESVASLLPSPCLQRGEPLPFHPSARWGDNIEAVFGMCSSPGELFIFVQEVSPIAQPGAPIVHQEIQTSQPISVTLTGLPQGRYSVLWKYGAFATDWQVFAEIVVNGVVRFRRYQSSEDANPSNKIFVTIEVLS